LLPIGIASNDWDLVYDEENGTVDESTEIVIKVDTKLNPNATDYEPNAGNFHAVDFPHSSGGKGYREYLSDGYDDKIYLNQTFDTETGNMVGPTKQGVDDRIGACTCTDPHDCPGECALCSTLSDEDGDGIICPRIGIVPVLNILSYDTVSGKKEVEVIGFAAVFIIRVENPSSVYARFVDGIITPEGEFLNEGESYGVDTVRLIN
jgi:hypothetical protein